MKEFKDILREKRKERKITQTDLANALKTTQDRITRWETGKFYPSYVFLITLADYFNCTVDELMGRA